MAAAIAGRKSARRHACDLRRSVPGRRARLSRGQARRDRHHAGVSAVAAADRGAGARDDRRRRRDAFGGRRHEKAAGVVRRPPFRPRPARRPCPATADPCGENGEFHSFVSAGPMLSRKIPVSVGETVERDGFAFADLLPATTVTYMSPQTAVCSKRSAIGLLGFDLLADGIDEFVVLPERRLRFANSIRSFTNSLPSGSSRPALVRADELLVGAVGGAPCHRVPRRRSTSRGR